MEKNYKECIDYFNKKLFNKFRKLGILPTDCWVAGGAVRDFFSKGYVSYQGDYDLYFKNKDNADKVERLILGDTVKESVIKSNPEIIFKSNLLTRIIYEGKRLDLVKRYFPSMEDTIDAFDFTVCCCATNGEEIKVHPTFFADLAKKRLVINKIFYPLSTLQRVQKYIKKDFTICNGGLLEIARTINKLDLSNPSENTFEFYPDGTPRFPKFD